VGSGRSGIGLIVEEEALMYFDYVAELLRSIPTMASRRGLIAAGNLLPVHARSSGMKPRPRKKQVQERTKEKQHE
jgi:hypothetical protein